MMHKEIPAGAFGGQPIHPGQVLHEDFMVPFGLSAYALAKALHVPQTRLGEILAGRRAVSADTALRLARYFGNSAEFWLNLQSIHDLRRAELEVGGEIARTVAEHELVSA